MQFLLASLTSPVSDMWCLNAHFTETWQCCFPISLSFTYSKEIENLKSQEKVQTGCRNYKVEGENRLL